MIRLVTMKIRESAHKKFKRWADKRGLKFSAAIEKLLEIAKSKDEK